MSECFLQMITSQDIHGSEELTEIKQIIDYYVRNERDI